MKPHIFKRGRYWWANGLGVMTHGATPGAAWQTLQEAIGDALDELEAIPLDDEPETGKDRIIEAIRKLRAAL